MASTFYITWEILKYLPTSWNKSGVSVMRLICVRRVQIQRSNLSLDTGHLSLQIFFYFLSLSRDYQDNILK